ncbi:NAD(P)-binding protein [Aquicoccus sp. SCR17]|nr:NAD(P)-binding protein [Carideicomes alvinocaridis]
MAETLDCVVVGSGPAGLQAAYFLKKRGHAVRVLERGSRVSEFFRRFPRHRKLISINKVHTGLSNPDTRLRYDWNSLLSEEGLEFRDYSRRYFPDAEDMVRYMDDYARLVGEDVILLDHDVTRISRPGETFRVDCAGGQSLEARHVIVATGVSQPYRAGYAGEELVENYYDFDPDPERFIDKRVLILGKGNSAFETADSLIETAASIHVMSPRPVKFAWNTHFVGHLRAVNNNFLDTYQLKSQNAVIDAEVTRIEKVEGVYKVTCEMQAAEGHEMVLTYDHVIACTGFRFDPSIFDEAIRPGLCQFGKLPRMTAQWESEEVENLWFAGTIMQYRDYKKTMSGFVHGFRHNVKALAEFVSARLTGGAYPHDSVPLEREALTDAVVERISTSSGMFLQPSFLGDVIRLSGEGAGRRWQDVPMAWALEPGGPAATGACLTVTLEFGDFGINPMHVKRRHEASGEHVDPFIHPVVRHYVDGALQATTHLADHLDADWRPVEERDAGAPTVTAMTFADLGETLSPAEVARRQLSAFWQKIGLGRGAGGAAPEDRNHEVAGP